MKGCVDGRGFGIQIVNAMIEKFHHLIFKFNSAIHVGEVLQSFHEQGS